MKQLSAQDAQFLFMENGRNLSNVAMACIYGPPKGSPHTSIVEALLAQLDQRIKLSPVFTRRLIRVPMDLDYPYWADDEYFDLHRHVHQHRLADGDSWSQFCDLMGRIYSRPFDTQRPLWEMHVVENLGQFLDVPEGSFALIIKVHHAAVDGAAMMKLFGCLSDRDAEGTPFFDELEEAESSGPPPSPREIWRSFLANQIKSPLRVSRGLLGASKIAVGSMFSKKGEAAVAEQGEIPITRFSLPVSPDKTFDAIEFPLANLKAMQHLAEEAKINDVVLALCGGALRRYLEKHNELPPETLVGWVPINTRGKGAAEGEGNQVTAMTTDLYTQVEDPIERLAKITAQTQLAKAGKTGTSIRLIAEITRSMPSPVLAATTQMLLRSGATAKLSNVAISNVPGSPVPLYLKGSRCLHQFGMTPLGDGMGLFIVALGYDGKLSLSLTSTLQMVPDMDFLRDCLNASFTELDQAAGIPSNKRSVTSKRPRASSWKRN